MANFKRIILIGIEALHLAQILSKGHFFFLEKGVGHPKIQHCGLFFKMAAISVKCSLLYVNHSNSDVGITFCENTLFRMFFFF